MTDELNEADKIQVDAYVRRFFTGGDGDTGPNALLAGVEPEGEAVDELVRKAINLPLEDQ